MKLIFLVFLFIFAKVEGGQEKNFPFVRKSSEFLYWIKWIRVDQLNREVSFSAVLSRPSRELEVLISSSDGRVYESIFVSDVAPSTVHLCLFLLGAKSGKEESNSLSSRLDIDLEWEGKGGRIFRMNIEEFMGIDERDKASPKGWIFTGNLRGNEGNIALIYNNLPTIIESPFKFEFLENHLEKSFSTYGFYAGFPVRIVMSLMK